MEKLPTYEVTVSLFKPIDIQDTYRVVAKERYEAISSVLADYSKTTLDYVSKVNAKIIQD